MNDDGLSLAFEARQQRRAFESGMHRRCMPALRSEATRETQSLVMMVKGVPIQGQFGSVHCCVCLCNENIYVHGLWDDTSGGPVAGSGVVALLEFVDGPGVVCKVDKVNFVGLDHNQGKILFAFL